MTSVEKYTYVHVLKLFFQIVFRSIVEYDGSVDPGFQFTNPNFQLIDFIK